MKNDRGVTLVELLAVLGIIGVLTVITIPMVSLFTDSRSTDRGTRMLFNLLRSAQIYAGTHNRPTAIVFNVRKVLDSETEEIVRVMDAVMMVTQFTRKELIDMGLRPIRPQAGESGIFFPVGETAGQFRFIDGDACLIDEAFDFGDKLIQATDEDDNLIFEQIQVIDGDGNIFFVDGDPVFVEVPELISSTGMRPIRVVDGNGWPRLMNTTDTFADEELQVIFEDHLPGYVFMPTGDILVSEHYSKQRVKLRVAVLPDQPREDRFVIDPETDEIVLDIDGEQVQRVSSIVMYTATGRVKIEEFEYIFEEE